MLTVCCRSPHACGGQSCDQGRCKTGSLHGQCIHTREFARVRGKFARIRDKYARIREQIHRSSRQIRESSQKFSTNTRIREQIRGSSREVRDEYAKVRDPYSHIWHIYTYTRVRGEYAKFAKVLDKYAEVLEQIRMSSRKFAKGYADTHGSSREFARIRTWFTADTQGSPPYICEWGPSHPPFFLRLMLSCSPH